MTNSRETEEESPDEMDTRFHSAQTRIAARQALVARRLARREWERRQAAKQPEKEAPTSSLLDRLRERYIARTGGTEEQFKLFLPRLLAHLRTSDPALADRLLAELARTSTTDATDSTGR